MTLQHRLEKLAHLDAVLNLVKDSLSKEDFAVYQACLPAIERLLSYAPASVRRAVSSVILAKLDVHDLPEGTADHLRRLLILNLLDKGPQDILSNFALKVMFRDISLQEWANQHDIAYMSWSRVTADGGKVEFIKFERAYHDGN